MKTAFIHHPDLARYDFAPDHPFKPSRTRVTIDTCRRLGLLDRPWMRLIEAAPCPADLLREHLEPAYLDALIEANEGRFEPEMLRFGLGTADCPVFPGVLDFARLVVGCTTLGCDLLLRGEADRVFSPSGGFHHAGSGHAEGFCYVNDCVIAIRRLRAAGKRVAYVDIDAHHGNGVQQAFRRDGDVLTASIHETGRTLYPWGGFETEIGEGPGRGTNLNVPLEPESDDDIFYEAWDTLVVPVVRAFAPDVLVSQLGVDGIRGDPLTHLAMTNNGIAHAVTGMLGMAPLWLALGGGGYAMHHVSRAWALAWAILNGIEQAEDEFLGAVGGVLLGDTGAGPGGLRDMRAYTHGAAKERARQSLREVRAFLAERDFPVLASPPGK